MARRISIVGRKGHVPPSMRSPLFGGFTPYQVPKPPPGYYDPALDAQEGAANRGLLDLRQDIDMQAGRDRTDYGLGREDLQRGFARGQEDLGLQRQGIETGYGRSVADVERGYGRNVEDLHTARSRGDEDYQRNVAELTRRYTQLGTTQRQQQARAGVMRGGAMLQAAAKRTANEGHDRQPLDTGHQRFSDDSRLMEGRLGEDRSTTLGRLGEDRTTQLSGLDLMGRRMQEDTDLGLGRLALQLAPPDASNPVGGRSWQDRGTQLTRAQRENTNFGLDVGAQRQYQAAGAGWTPPPRPKNEYIDAYGNARRVLRRGNQTVAVDPTGRVLWRRPRGR